MEAALPGGDLGAASRAELWAAATEALDAALASLNGPDGVGARDSALRRVTEATAALDAALAALPNAGENVNNKNNKISSGLEALQPAPPAGMPPATPPAPPSPARMTSDAAGLDGILHRVDQTLHLLRDADAEAGSASTLPLPLPPPPQLPRPPVIPVPRAAIPLRRFVGKETSSNSGNLDDIPAPGDVDMSLPVPGPPMINLPRPRPTFTAPRHAAAPTGDEEKEGKAGAGAGGAVFTAPRVSPVRWGSMLTSMLGVPPVVDSPHAGPSSGPSADIASPLESGRGRQV